MENKIQKLPSQAELYDDNIELAFKQDQFKGLVNSEPKKEWIKVNTYANNSKYIPIGIVETMMQRIFKKHKVEILREGTMFNAVYMVVRVHYLDLISNEWDFHDGAGAVQVQTKAGASPADLASINNNAVMMALPAAKSYAIKDACEHIGKIFGRDLNRKDTLDFMINESLRPIEYEDLKTLYDLKSENLSKEKQDYAERILNEREEKSYRKLHNELKNS